MVEGTGVIWGKTVKGRRLKAKGRRQMATGGRLKVEGLRRRAKEYIRLPIASKKPKGHNTLVSNISLITLIFSNHQL
jgi:hypothetical protein